MQITATPQDRSKRIDSFLSEKTSISRSQIQRLITKGLVRLNKLSSFSQNYRIKGDEVITIELEAKTEPELIPQSLPIKILYQDDYVVVVDKPAGMVVYPCLGHSSGTLMNAIRYHFKELASVGQPLRPGVVHRLDKDTSGVIVVALKDSAYYSLVEQFKSRVVTKRYLALIYGTMKDLQGEINLGIGRSVSDRKKMSTRTKQAKEASTQWKTLKSFGDSSLVEITIKTGRTHQIRVHMASIGHPVLGDGVYGNKLKIERGKRVLCIARQMLHAKSLGFYHPQSKDYLEFNAEIPEDMKACIDWLMS